VKAPPPVGGGGCWCGGGRGGDRGEEDDRWGSGCRDDGTPSCVRSVYQTTGVHFIVVPIISVDATKKRRTDMHGG
jgi:hypothetical protein